MSFVVLAYHFYKDIVHAWHNWVERYDFGVRNDALKQDRKSVV